MQPGDCNPAVPIQPPSCSHCSGQRISRGLGGPRCEDLSCLSCSMGEPRKRAARRSREGDASLRARCSAAFLAASPGSERSLPFYRVLQRSSIRRSAPIRPDPPRSADPPIRRSPLSQCIHISLETVISRGACRLSVYGMPCRLHQYRGRSSSYISGLGTAFPVPASRFPGPAVPLGPLAGWRAHLRPPGRAPTGTPLKCQRWLLSRILL